MAKKNSNVKKKSKGLGDTIEKILDYTGVADVVEKTANALGIEDCGCAGRRDKLNELFPYSPQDEDNEDFIIRDGKKIRVLQ